MKWANRFNIAFVFFAVACEIANASSFSVDLTQVGIGINAGFPNIVSGGFNNVSSPFHDNVSRSLQQSTVLASYDFMWTPDVGDFSILSNISCQGPSSQSIFQCGSSGKITITTNVNVLLTTNFNLTWHLPLGDREGIIDFDVVTTAIPNVSLLDRACGGSTFGGNTDGICGSADQTLLPAGGQYRIQYAINFVNYSGSPTVLSTGTSAITLHLAPAVPEPSAIGLLATSALVFYCRRSQIDT